MGKTESAAFDKYGLRNGNTTSVGTAGPGVKTSRPNQNLFVVPHLMNLPTQSRNSHKKNNRNANALIRGPGAHLRELRRPGNQWLERKSMLDTNEVDRACMLESK